MREKKAEEAERVQGHENGEVITFKVALHEPSVKVDCLTVSVTMKETMESVNDVQLQEAKLTIQRLARKYLVRMLQFGLEKGQGMISISKLLYHPQHKAQKSVEESSGLDIVRVEDCVETCDQQLSEQREAEMETEKSDVFDFRGSQESKSKENRAKRERKPKTSAKLTPQRTEKVLVPRGRARLQGTPVKRAQKSNPSLSSPDFKIPKPTLGHSTPSSADRNAIRRHSLFGFEALDSPLTLSPVTSTPYLQDSPFKSPEEKITKSSSYSRLIGTYDIPIRKPSPRRQQARRKIAQVNKLMTHSRLLVPYLQVLEGCIQATKLFLLPCGLSTRLGWKKKFFKKIFLWCSCCTYFSFRVFHDTSKPLLHMPDCCMSLIVHLLRIFPLEFK